MSIRICDAIIVSISFERIKNADIQDICITNADGRKNMPSVNMHKYMIHITLCEMNKTLYFCKRFKIRSI